MIKKAVFMVAAFVIAPGVTHAFTVGDGPTTLNITGYGTAGMIEANSQKADFLGDWRVRGEGRYDASFGRIGAVYSIDAQTVDGDEYIDDLFAFWQSRDFGRIEVGMTDSVAGKLGLGLPDVGGMRVNNNPLFFKKIYPDGPVIADANVDSGDQSLRVNLVSNPTGAGQYGLSFATIADGFDYALDAAAKFRYPAGKTKTALSIGASFIDNPDNFAADPYAPNLTADWRAQLGVGANVQYNSWIFGINTRAIYDRNAISAASDGINAGAGISYDLLNYSLSLSYILSSVGIWHDDDRQYTDNTIIGSFRYKYSANVDGWTSLGMSTKTPFIAAGLRLSF